MLAFMRLFSLMVTAIIGGSFQRPLYSGPCGGTDSEATNDQRTAKEREPAFTSWEATSR